ncbi:uncharacterized protein LOC126379172 [Pectinophora gossypiella]|uniref:uncharacterized protein LOC126366149 n=1 Tax=Pectinophora gossypiella TaxID=13191 RepID=UPI00214E6322|nr:uncharacterized protein LOC126366149 [Pectinophora gossypiella]XP_049874803.1 uncharacterized protein LOC126372937 [Pectinophora gossypiella]XP_049883791.1 uncharacterized protein LOC126379172 [Pectinophora gossypiella]
MAALGLQLQKINNNPGVLPVKEGQAVISSDKWIVLKVLDLQVLREDLEFNVNRYSNLNNHVLSFFDKQKLQYEIHNIKIQTDHLMNMTIDKFSQIIPLQRSRRGILNPLGSLIKAITGNLDNEDAIKYEKLINSIGKRENILMERITLIYKIMHSFVNVSKSARNNFVQVDKSLWEIRKQLNETSKTLLYTQLVNAYNLFLHTFEMIYIKLDEVETAVAFSRLYTLHQSIINTNELLNILSSIAKSHRLLFDVNLENLQKLEQNIQLKAYTKGNQITFILEIPLISKENYIYYKMIPLPITNPFNQTTLILPKNPYLILEGSKAVWLKQPCREVDKEFFMCFKDEWQQPPADPCIEDLIRFSSNTSNCNPILVTVNNIKIEPLKPNQWIVYSKLENILKKSCGLEENREIIKGTYILTIDDDCKVNINELMLERHQTFGAPVTSYKTAFMTLPDILKTEPVPASRHLNLDETALMELQTVSMEAERAFNRDGESESVIKVKSISLGTVILYVSLAISLCIFIVYKFKLHLLLCYQSHQNGNDDFDSNGGGVMQPTPPRIVISTGGRR